jgi:hypothetical protein
MIRGVTIPTFEWTHPERRLEMKPLPLAIAAAAGALGLILARPAAAAGYNVQEIGALGGANVTALSLNDRGQVVGTFDLPNSE